ncbi:MAG: hypothetical protein QOH90_2212 [Actinomycetota bacterium]|nr:hypothetical protein [Actinomycetota bacterium]
MRGDHGTGVACVILSYGSEPGLLESIESIRSQDVPADEIILVHSGSHDPRSSLQRAGIEIPLHVSDKRLSTGAARNVGIRRTQSPIVAFLAADCQAAPGWIANRLRHHVRHEAVASAMRPLNGDPLTVAYHAYRFATRDPEVVPDLRKRYGVSYRREVFDRFGMFSFELYYGEDTEFIDRISSEIEVAWAPDVVTFHRPPDSVVAQCIQISKQIRRRKWYLRQTAGGYSLRQLVGEALFRIRAGRGVRSRERKRSLWFRMKVAAFLWTFIGTEIMCVFLIRPALDG